MPLLFSYGTLQEEAVQLATFHRVLVGRPDVLVGFERGRLARYANASYTGNPQHGIAGTVFEVSDAELEAADIYERQADYVRVRASLMSGEQAWVYVHSGSAPA